MSRRRRYMDVKGGSIPYQRIEYLESSGTQYINTNIPIYIGDEIYCRYQLNSTTVASKALLSSGTGTYQTLFLQQSTGSYIKYFASGTAPQLNYGAAANTWYELNVSGTGLFKIGNVQGTSSPQAEIDANNSLYVLMRRNNASGFVGKISNFTLKRNGVNILDLIPVRVEQVGYMYDTVSGELFGNAGTGDFVLGPDIGGTDYERQYLTFEALEDSEFNIAVATEYSIDGGDTWTALAASTASPTIHAGEKILWRKSASQIYTAFGATGNFNVYGNIMSLLYKDNFINKTTIGSSQAFANLFKSNTHVISAENLILPATSIALSGYQSMFYGCTNLIAAPKVLPNASASQYTYGQMFYGCTKLEASPTILVQTLTKNMFRETFRGCSKLKWIKHMATSIASESCYNWVMDVPSGGTFIKDANTTWGRGQGGIPGGWTIIDE